MQYNNFDVRSRGTLTIPVDRWKKLRELEKKVAEQRKLATRATRIREAT
ncbi:MAG: hypothetical protein AAF491_01360 [Verrucomicrobiota bacterium]